MFEKTGGMIEGRPKMPIYALSAAAPVDAEDHSKFNFRLHYHEGMKMKAM